MPTTKRSHVLPFVALVAVGLILGGWAGAEADGARPEDGFVTLTTPKSITTATSVAAGKTYSFVARAGTSTVPGVARLVRLQISAKGAVAGRVEVEGNPGQFSATSLSWGAGGSVTGLVDTSVGLSNKVTLHNRGAGSVTVGVKIVGYSELVLPADIDAAGAPRNSYLRDLGPPRWQNMNPSLTTYKVTKIDQSQDPHFVGSASCYPFQYPVAGGLVIASTTSEGEVRTSAPLGKDWVVEIDFASVAAPRTVTINVVCARLP